MVVPSRHGKPIPSVEDERPERPYEVVLPEEGYYLCVVEALEMRDKYCCEGTEQSTRVGSVKPLHQFGGVVSDAQNHEEKEGEMAGVC